MPKELTHWMVADKACALLPAGSRMAATIAGHRAAYLGGAVLPDTLAHIFRGPFHPAARELGHRFHDPQGSSYLPLILAERQFPQGLPPELFACLLGVISHIEADIALHPYVYAATGSAGLGEHYRLETAIDVHFLRAGMAPAGRRLKDLLCHRSREVMVKVAGLLFDPEEELPRAALKEAVALHCRFQGLYDRTLWKLAARLLGRLAGAPYNEQQHLFYPLRPWKVIAVGGGVAWRHPESGEMSTFSVDDLARRAVERTAAVFSRIEAAGSLSAALADPPGENLLTGLHGVTKERQEHGK